MLSLWSEYAPIATQVYNPESSSVRADNVIEVRISFIKICALLMFRPSFFHPMFAWGIPGFNMLHCSVIVADPTASTNLDWTATTFGGTRIIHVLL